MAALKKRSEARFWDNDDAALDQSRTVSENGDESDEDSDAEAADGVGVDEEETGPSDEEGDEPSKGGGKRQSKAGESDMDWLRSKVGNDEGDIGEASGSEEPGAGKGGAEQGGNSGKGRQGRLENAVSSEGGHANASVQGPGDPSNEGDDEVESGLSVGRLFVRNLPYSTTDDDLRELFGTYGALSDVHLPVDDVNKVRHCVAFGSVWELYAGGCALAP